MKILLSLFSVLWMGCAAEATTQASLPCPVPTTTSVAPAPAPVETVTPTPTSTPYPYQVEISDRFTSAHKAEIEKAVQSWGKLLRNQASFTILYRNPLPVALEKDTIRIVNWAHAESEADTLGHTEWQNYKDGTTHAATIWVDEKNLEASKFYATVLHEFGHALNQEHWTDDKHPESVMAPYVRDNPGFITCADQNRLCGIWKCEMCPGIN